MSKVLLKGAIVSPAGGLSLLCAAAFNQYNSDVTAYLACLQDERAANSASVSAAQAMQIKTMQSKKNKSAVEELESNVAKFNAQVRAFKSKKA